MRGTIYALAALICCSPCALRADFGDPAIDEVIVVAARTPRHTQDVAATVDVVSRAALLDNMALSLSDVMRYTPGVSVAQADTRFADTELTVRGLSGNRVVTLIDHIPVPDQFDIGAFANAGQNYLMPGSIDRIEILRGPASTLFGSDALGGVVAVMTRNPADYADGFGLGASQTYNSSNDASNTELWTAGGNERLEGVLHAGILNAHEHDHSSGGSDDEIDQRRVALMAKGGVRLGDGWLRLKAEQLDEQVDSDLSAVLGYGRRYRNTTMLIGDDRRKREALSLSYEWHDGALSDRAQVSAFWQETDVTQHTLEERGAASVPVTIRRLFEYDTRTHGVIADFEKLLTLFGTSHRLGWGLSATNAKLTEKRNASTTDWATNEVSNVLLGEVMPVRDFPVSKVREVGVYLHDEIFLGAWTLLPGLRYDAYDLDAKSDAVFAEDHPTLPVVDISEGVLAPKFGVLFDASPSTQIYLQYAHGFRAPPFEDVNIGLDVPIFNYRAIPNPDLEAETSDGIELGIRYQRPGWRFEAAIFGANYDDFIETKARIGFDDDGVLLFQSRNIEEARVYGLEFGIAARLDGWLDGLEWSAKASWQRGENRATSEPLNTIDPPELVTTFAWRPSDSWRLALTGTLVAGQDHTDTTSGEIFEPSGFALVDMTASFTPADRLRVDLGVFNLFDRTHWHWSAVRSRPPGDPLIDNLSGPGRHVSLALHLQL